MAVLLPFTLPLRRILIVDDDPDIHVLPGKAPGSSGMVIESVFDALRQSAVAATIRIPASP